VQVLVTGCTGYLGRAICRGAHRDLDMPWSPSVDPPHERLPATAIDWRYPRRGGRGQGGPSLRCIIHSAALVAVWRRNAQEFDDINVEG